jgi:hypothetical protein
MIGITIDAKEVIAALKKCQKLSKNLRKIVAEGINKGVDKGKPDAEGMIAARYNVGAPELGIKHASAGDLKGYLQGSGGMKHVSEFAPSSDGQTVSVEIIRGNRRPIGPGSKGPGISGAFIVGGGRVMERRQPEKYPIFPVMTIGIPQMLYYKGISNPVRDGMTEVSTGHVVSKWKI